MNQLFDKANDDIHKKEDLMSLYMLTSKVTGITMSFLLIWPIFASVSLYLIHQKHENSKRKSDENPFQDLQQP